jgi:prepilin-type N-terminal cleavage/methylation domain-containing protein
MKDENVSRSGERGFSLIEVLIAILILTIGLLSLAQMMLISANSNALSGRMTSSAALAKEQLELLKAAPFYTNPADISIGSVNPLLQPGGNIEQNEGNYFQHYDPDGQPLPNADGAAFVVRWRVDQVVPPLGDGNLPLAMFRITVRCTGTSEAYRVVGDAILMTFRTANIG